MNAGELPIHEDQVTEFKKSLSLTREGFQALTAMLNADTARGQVIFGVAPGGEPVGIEPGDVDKAQRSLVEHARLKSTRELD